MSIKLNEQIVFNPQKQVLYLLQCDNKKCRFDFALICFPWNGLDGPRLQGHPNRTVVFCSPSIPRLELFQRQDLSLNLIQQGHWFAHVITPDIQQLCAAILQMLPEHLRKEANLPCQVVVFHLIRNQTATVNVSRHERNFVQTQSWHHTLGPGDNKEYTATGCLAECLSHHLGSDSADKHKHHSQTHSITLTVPFSLYLPQVCKITCDYFKCQTRTSVKYL